MGAPIGSQEAPKTLPGGGIGMKVVTCQSRDKSVAADVCHIRTVPKRGPDA